MPRVHRPSPTARRALGVLVLAVVTLAGPAAAWAHAELDTASPEAGSTVEGTPAEVAGTFTEPLTNASSIELRDADRMSLATGGRDPSDRMRLVLVPPTLPAGEYEVRWTAISTVDGHPERGTWRFTVTEPPTPTPTAIPTPTSLASPSAVPATTAPSAAPTPAATPAPSPSEAPGDPAAGETDAILPIVGALVLLGLLGAVLLGRRGRGGSPA